jgi:hypothetical protein
LDVGYTNIASGRDAQPSAKAREVIEFVLEELQSWSEERLRAATKSPFKFAIPYAKPLLNQAARVDERSRHQSITILDPNLSDFWTEHLQDEEEQHFKAWILAERLATSSENYQEFILSNGIPYSSSVHQMACAFQTLLTKTTRLKDTLKDRFEPSHFTHVT